MSNGARHALGVVAGLLLPPLVAAALWYGVGELALQLQRSQISWPAVGALVAAGVVLAFLAGSRLSPIASLLGGLAFTGLGAVPLVEIMQGVRLIPDNLLPPFLEAGFLTLAASGTMLVIGLALLVGSLFPSRWRARAEVVYEPEYESEPMSYRQQVPGPEDATRPMFRE